MLRSKQTRLLLIIPPVLLALALLVSTCRNQADSGSAAAGSRAGEGAVGPEYVGRESCRECHEREYSLFQGSDHDLAMDLATDTTVLGNFNDFTLEHLGVRTRFYRQDGKFMVHTEGEGGEFRDYEIKYVLGIRPLQQYLVDFPGGAFQMLPFCWDSRTVEEGGRRWFHIYDR